MKIGITKRFLQLGLLAGLVAISSVSYPVLAADQPSPSAGESILLSPTSKRYSLDAGTTKQDSFDIVNDGTTAFNFVVYARPYSVSSEAYEPDFVTNSRNSDAYKWVQFDQPSYTAEPGKTVKVNYTIRVPGDAAPGGHYGVLFAETQPGAVSEGTAIIRKKRLGAILYATVNGDVKTSGKVEATDVPFFQLNAPLKIRSTVNNSGNTDFVVSSSVQVSDVLGGIKYKSTKEVTVLPNQPRQVNNDWKNPAWIGLYKVEQTNKFLDTTRSSSSFTLLVPLWTYLLLAALIVGRGIYAVRHRLRKK